MARWMNEDGGYRAAVKIVTLKKDPQGGPPIPSTAIDYIGPYDKPGSAKAAVTTERRNRKNQFVDGWIEKATWERVEE